ncbi:MAG TPA: hypothetical protein ENK71_00755 [Epsilonproteobacteria bacterium]|nr:hypothetical protein [Campylobacterota bacterium]
MSNWVFHIHLIAAISWIGGSVFMFVLGVTLRDKEAQKAVYPHVGPIFGWFELAALILLLLTGFILGDYYSLLQLLFSDSNDDLSYSLKMKAVLVAILTIATIVHFIIAYRTNDKERTQLENLFSRGSSMLIFILNLFVMHYGIVLRNILN